MELSYPHKRSPQAIIGETPEAVLEEASVVGNGEAGNLLIRGDNLTVMKSLLTHFNMAGRVDLVYIDPPFSTNTVYKHNPQRTQTVSAAADDDVAYSDKLKGPQFLEFLRERLIFLRELMADHASIYVHIDYKIGHYVKVLMDEVFGERNFRNDITRVKCNPKNFARKGYGNVKDMILFYTKTDDFTWNEPRQPLTEEEIERLFPKRDPRGRRYTTTPLHAPGETQNGNTGKEWRGQLPPKGRHWRYDPSVLDELDRQGLIEWSTTGNPRKIIYADEAKRRGRRLQDIWEFKDPQYPRYPTEKSLDLLRTIVRTSSSPGQLVLDCFCGSGTALVAAQEFGRHWVGIDNSEIAIKTSWSRLWGKQRLQFNLAPGFRYLEEKTPQAADKPPLRPRAHA